MRNSKMYPIEPIPPKKSSEEIDAEMREFLERGGQIKEVPRGASATWDQSQYGSSRRRFKENGA